MRLTLRNLLAYMDDLLDPESARIIGQKTEESEFASGLLHRIRDVTRRTKLGAPEVIDRKAALNPNTVAEYLDNTLPSDRVTDFEKVCLDSDVELAEVAACHQILTLVLGEPAEVRSESRVRMYHLPETAASHTYVEGDEAGVGQENRRIDTPPTLPEGNRRPAVPEYLLETRRRRRRLYWIATLAVVLCIAVYLGATGGLNGLFGSGNEPANLDGQVVMNLPPQPRLPDGPSSLPEPLVPDSGPSALSSPTTPESSILPVGSTDAASVSPAPTSVASEPSGATATTPDAGVGPQPIPGSVVPVTPTPTPSPTMNGASETPIPVTPLEPPILPPGPDPDPGQVASVTVPAGLPDDREPIIAEPMVPEVAAQGRDMGRLITPEEMALVTDDVGGPFYRIANSKPLRAGQRVVSLPTSRPGILVDGRLHVEMVDGGELQLLPSDEDGPLNLDIACGRMLFMPADEAGVVTVSLRAGGITGDLSLADSTTLVAIEVGRADGPIQDPLTQPAPMTARLWGVSGRFSWKAAGEAETSLESPMMVDLMSDLGSAPSPGVAPAGVRADLTSSPNLAQRASGLLNRELGFDKPADLILRENVYHRQKEMRGLARQSLSWIEDFEPVVAVLDDPERYSEWPDVIDLLCDSVRRGPTARAVRESMVTVYGNRGDELYGLLWKYDAEELPSEAAKQLVQYLEDETMACRVLSFRNLNRITGLGYYYRPQENELERRPSVQRWSAWADHLPGPGAPKSTGTPPVESAEQLQPAGP